MSVEREIGGLTEAVQTLKVDVHDVKNKVELIDQKLDNVLTKNAIHEMSKKKFWSIVLGLPTIIGMLFPVFEYLVK